MFFFLGKGLSFFLWEAKENPLHTPRAFFEEFLVVGMWSGVGLFLYALVLDVERCADVVFSASIVVNVALLTYFCMLRY